MLDSVAPRLFLRGVGHTVVAQEAPVIHAHRSSIRRIPYTGPMLSVVLTVFGTLSFVVGSIDQHALGSILGACLLFTVPASLLFSWSVVRMRAEDVFGAILASLIAGLFMVVAAIAAAISSAYANPCFGLARCTRGQSFGSLSLITAMVAFLLAAALGLFITPTVFSLVRRRRVQS